MSLEDITLPTNKSETRVSNNRRTIRSGEKGLAIKVTLVDANDQPYDLSTFDLEFNEIKDQGKVVLDDGSGNASGSFEKIDPVGGTFSYTLAPQVYSASGRAWFVVKQGDTIIDTTKDFYFDVLQDATIHIDNDNYVSSLQAEIDHFKATTQRVDEEWSNLKSTMDSGYQGYVSDFDKLKSGWQSQTAKIDADAQAQIDQIKANAKTQSDTIAKNASDQSTAIQTKADTQLKSQADAFNSTLADQVKQIETERDKAISDATAEFTADVDSWTKQFNDWLTKTKSDYTSDIADLQSKLKTVQDGINDVDTKRFPDMQAKVKQVQDAVDKAQANFDNIDFSSYAKKADLEANYYTKTEVDSKTSGTVVTAYDVASKNPTTVKNSYTSEELVDQGALGQFADQINQLKGRQTVDAPDFNTLTDTGVYYITTPDKGKNDPTNQWGVLAVFNGNNQRITQIYFADDGTDAVVRTYGWITGKNVWGPWNQIAWTSDITNLQNQIQANKSDVTSLQGTVNGKADKTDVNNLQSMITGLSAKVDSLQQNSLKIVPITQADYDALSDDQKANGMYAIGDSN